MNPQAGAAPLRGLWAVTTHLVQDRQRRKFRCDGADWILTGCGGEAVLKLIDDGQLLTCKPEIAYTTGK